MASALENNHASGGLNGQASGQGPKPTDSEVTTTPTIEGLLSRDGEDTTGIWSDADDSRQSDQEDSQSGTSPVISPASMSSPPYWLNAHPHQRSASTTSTDSFLPVGAITLRDNETNDNEGRNNACWAKMVEVTDYVIVNSSATNIGAFVVWNIRVETLTVSPDPVQRAW
jgi:hypothetical protein